MLTFPFDVRVPVPGEMITVAPGVQWLRMPLPFALDHINLWALNDGDGWTLVDTGFGSAETRALWDQHFASALNGRPVHRIIVTHHHPDHVGNARWLADRTGAKVWMTETEFLITHAVRNHVDGFTPEHAAAHFGSHGLPEHHQSAIRVKQGGYKRGVPEALETFVPIIHGSTVDIDGRQWEIIVVRGHSPEHAALYCRDLNVLISGDQVLPRITTNVGVWPHQPEANPLQMFFDSLTTLHSLPDVLVLPSHERVFRGLHARIAMLRNHHEGRFAALLSACGAEARSAFELLPVLFSRKLDDHQLLFAMGEAIAHLNYLTAHGSLLRTRRESGVWQFAPVGSERKA